MTYVLRRELVSQIAEVQSPSMAEDATQPIVMGKLIQDLSCIDNLCRDDGSGKYKEERRICSDFDKIYLLGDGYTLVLIAIMGNARRLKEVGNERIS